MEQHACIGWSVVIKYSIQHREYPDETTRHLSRDGVTPIVDEVSTEEGGKKSFDTQISNRRHHKHEVCEIQTRDIVCTLSYHISFVDVSDRSLRKGIDK